MIHDNYMREIEFYVFAVLDVLIQRNVFSRGDFFAFRPVSDRFAKNRQSNEKILGLCRHAYGRRSNFWTIFSAQIEEPYLWIL